MNFQNSFGACSLRITLMNIPFYHYLMHFPQFPCNKFPFEVWMCDIFVETRYHNIYFTFIQKLSFLCLSDFFSYISFIMSRLYYYRYIDTKMSVFYKKNINLVATVFELKSKCITKLYNYALITVRLVHRMNTLKNIRVIKIVLIGKTKHQSSLNLSIKT